MCSSASALGGTSPRLATPLDVFVTPDLVVPFLQGYKSVKWVNRIEAYPRDPIGIKRLLSQSKTGRLGQAWLDKLAIVPPTGRPSDP